MTGRISIRYVLNWVGLFLVLVGIVALIYYSTSKVEYIWGWNKVPGYLAFKTSEGGFMGWNAGQLSRGLWLTLKISVASTFFAIIIGLFTGLARISTQPILRWISTGYVELIRGTPLLVQIFIWYFFVGTVFGLSRFACGTAALAMFAGAYVAEIVRAGIQSISRGQMEAARSVGMTYVQAMRHIVLPQAFRRILPPLAGQFISLIKDSSLVSVIALNDLTKSGREVMSSSFAPFEVWFTVAGMYLILTFTLSMFTQWLERRYGMEE